MQKFLTLEIIKNLFWTIIITKFKSINLSIIIEIAKTIKIIKIKIIIQNYNKLLIEIKYIFNLTKTTTIVIIQD